VRIKILFTLVSLFTFLFANNVFAQKKTHGIENKELLKKLKVADELFDNHSYFNAQEHYETILKLIPQNEYVLYKTGMTYFKARDFVKSESVFQKIYNWKSNKTAYPLALFHYGASLKMNGKYDEAKKAFLLYLKTRGKGKEEKYYKRIVRNEIKSCDFALEMVAFDTINNVKILPLPGKVNNAYSDFSPFQLNKDTLLFASIRSDSVIRIKYNSEESHPVKLYQSVTEGGEWSEPDELKNFNHPYDQTANGVYSPDRKSFYFTRCRPNIHLDQICVIYVSELNEGRWSKPKKLNKKINQKGYSSTQPTLGVMIKIVKRQKKEYPVLYYSSNKPKGKGGFDIWYSAVDKDGKFGKSVNCGTRVNSIGNEVTPHYDSQRRTLYFSSDYHYNAGGFDVFKSEGSLNRWSKAQNLGFPINSTFDDTYFVAPSENSLGFVVSNRPGGTALKAKTCCDDILQVEIITPPTMPIAGIVRPENQRKGLILENAVVGIVATGRVQKHLKVNKNINALLDSIEWINKTDSAGRFNLETAKSRNYSIVFAKDSFEVKYFPLDSILLKMNANILVEVFLPDLKDSTVINILSDQIQKPDHVNASSEYETLRSFNANSKEEVLEGDVFVLDKVNFETDKEGIKKDALASLDPLYKFLKNKPAVKIEISGHTDNQGSDEYNLDLSQRRANTVKDYLIKKGISKKRIVAIGYGETMPVAPNENEDGTDNPEGRKLNRRTEIRILGEGEE